MIARAIISGANPIPESAIRLLAGSSRRGPRADVDLSHDPRAGAFARAGQSNDFDGEEAETKSPATKKSVTEKPTKKPAANFHGRGLFDFCDDVNMPVICPTCQFFPREREAPPRTCFAEIKAYGRFQQLELAIGL
jgi:hypothetical protein